ncbi:unnamed protein product [Owenia fusiformis]|uniref:ABC-type xenobiotic transporter n=1 Tax=Owenia fusiformis TaxID=6347 RepID=A0A8J1U1X0_OWEFU|nr:unnamed protein product [Owenia fusiformis]
MAGQGWSGFCGNGVDNITVWTDNDFGHCFEQLAFVCSTHIILAIISAYYLAQRNYRIILHNPPMSFILEMRFTVSGLLFLAPVIESLLTSLWLKQRMSMVDIVTCIVCALSWILHFGFVRRLRKLYHLSLRGPLSLIVAYLFTAAAIGIKLRTVILQALDENPHLTKVKEYTTYITGGLHLIYLLTLVPGKRNSVLNSYDIDTVGINADVGDPLLSSSVQQNFYGGVTRPSPHLGNGEDGSNFLSKLSFWWVQPLVMKGSREKLSSPDDLFILPNKLNTRSIDMKFSSKLEKIQNEEQMDSDTSNSANPDITFSDGKKRRSFLKALHKTFGCEYYLLGVLKLLADGLGFAGPLLLNLLISYMENKSEPIEHGYLYASGLFLSTFLSAILSSQFTYHVTLVGLKIRAAIITTIYQRTLGANSVSLSKFSTGEVVNFMSTDTDRIINFCASFHQFWSLPFQIAVSLFLLYQQVGLAFLAGLGFALLLIPINRWLANKIGELSNEMMTQKDSRVKVMNEILYGIRVIKFYAWEQHFTQKIDNLRAAELKSLKGRKYLDALCVYFWATTPVLISILTFTTYALLGHQLTAAKVFTSLALFNMLIGPLIAFPWVLNGLMESLVSIKRVQKFLQLDQLDLNKYYNQRAQHKPDDVITIHNGTFSWQRQDGRPMRAIPDGEESIEAPAEREVMLTSSGTLKLNRISVNIKKGTLVGVIGKVGSGKSSLLNAVLAEMTREGGTISVENLNEGFGYVAQEAWIQHATVKENILFGKLFDVEKYDKVLEVCALEDDLKILPGGDNTEVGENGVTLSGGQKARISLARAVYQDKDVYLLDDPLSAVDAHVAAHLFHQCIMGALKDRTRILCTHHIKYLKHADVVLVMKDGAIVEEGSPQDVLSHLNFNDLKDGNPETKRTNEKSEKSESANEKEEDVGLVQEEEQDEGAVKMEVYKMYWNSVGKCLAPCVLVALLLMQASRNVNDWWLSFWVTHSHKHPGAIVNASSLLDNSVSIVQYSTTTPNSSFHHLVEASDNVTYYLTVYGLLAAANSIFTLFRAFLFAYGGICAAYVIHNKLLAAILKAPVSFFDTTPIGRIINRFSSDLYSIDDSLPFIMNILLAQFYGVIGTIVITCYGLPWFSLLLIPLAIFYYFIQHYYRKTSREVKRITSVTLSPIYAHFSESIVGLTSIRAFRESKRFMKDNAVKLTDNQRAQYAGVAVNQWLNIRLQMLGVAMVTGVAFIAVLEHHFQTVNPGLVGLAISYALSVVNLLSGVVTSFTETEKQMVSIERAAHYIENVPEEKRDGILHVPPYWPIQGAIQFNRVVLQYRDGLPNALNGVSFETSPSEKIGIVGRTGSGKSSLFLALFRLVELKGGQIVIDGINISHLDLQDLRSHLAIIPQDPFLFSGTVRDNLDPTSVYDDAELWNTLERCHLKETVERLGGLDAEVAERGRHFSLGQRQLVCLARAMLTQAKVLCIDEATASIDIETDTHLQDTIRKEFSQNTVITIAHRINTVMDSDRVIVMNKGKVAEFDSPTKLLENSKSMFSRLVYSSS